ncbi:alpha/beta hydrolase [Halomonas beimenensis]|uniref:Alpha/beta hydrolase n=1 Tax=Halomonas beimenensis TaxID=475662 RepID=A0A291P9I5_9GAMM|nr:alpha/beta hydrolase [Halomonas beimenensis]ATJ83527.1 hypothetical protein BEI_2540 [Halomonas beimenensis]
MLFITNRCPRQSIKTRIHRNFDFDLADNAAGNSVFFCERLGRDVYEELGSRRFLDRVAEEKHRQVLFYVHGGHRLPEDVFPLAESLQALCEAQEPDEVRVVPWIWPCDGDRGVVHEDWDDRASADLSGFAFARALQRLLYRRLADDGTGAGGHLPKPLSLLAHGLGARVLAESLHRWRVHHLPRGVPMLFRHVFLVAADLEDTALEAGGIGEDIGHVARQVTVYFAAEDPGLTSGGVHQVAACRLGHRGPADMGRVPRHVIAVDCDDVGRRHDLRREHADFHVGLSPAEPGVVFRHLFAALMAGRVFAEDETRRLTILREG